MVWRKKIFFDKYPGSSGRLRGRNGNVRSVSVSSRQPLLRPNREKSKPRSEAQRSQRRAGSNNARANLDNPLARRSPRPFGARDDREGSHCEERSDEAISSQGDRHAPSPLAMTERAVIARSAATKQSPV